MVMEHEDLLSPGNTIYHSALFCTIKSRKTQKKQELKKQPCAKQKSPGASRKLAITSAFCQHQA
jgi:hypothetical protein